MAKAKKVLVVEDMLDFRKILKVYMRSMGFQEILDANDGIPALSIVQQSVKENQPVDLVLADICMPGMSGLELLRAIRENPETNSIKVVLLTGEADQASVRQAIELKVDDYLVKPFSPAVLAEKLKKLGLIE